jgi:hypothetical protein
LQWMCIPCLPPLLWLRAQRWKPIMPSVQDQIQTSQRWELFIVYLSPSKPNPSLEPLCMHVCMCVCTSSLCYMKFLIQDNFFFVLGNNYQGAHE